MIQWVQQLLWQSAAMSIMVFAYFAATVWLKKRYASKWFYIAGIILLIGFCIPFRPTLSMEMEKVPEFMRSAASPATLAQPIAMNPSPATQGAAKSFPWRAVFLIWVAGACGTLLFHGIRHMHFIRAVRRWRTPVKDAQLLRQFEEAKRSLRLAGRDIGLSYCAWISSPMLVWLGKPTVMLPENMVAECDLRFILLHELIHYKRYDLLCRLAMLLSIAIHWYNPAVYFLAKLVTLQCEISCDEMVVNDQNREGRHQYAMSIIGAAQCRAKGYPLLTTYFSGGKDTMKKRIHSIYEPSKAKLGFLPLALAFLMVLLAGTSIAAAPNNEEIAYTLPETPVRFGEALDSYVVAWDAIEGIKSYHLGVCYEMEMVDGQALWATAEGYVSLGIKVLDDDGVEYVVEDAVWESMTLDGDATEADITALLNRYLEQDFAAKITKLLDVKLTMVAVRESGAPIQITIDIPVDAENAAAGH